VEEKTTIRHFVAVARRDGMFLLFPVMFLYISGAIRSMANLMPFPDIGLDARARVGSSVRHWCNRCEIASHTSSGSSASPRKVCCFCATTDTDDTEKGSLSFLSCVVKPGL
jgi:hypothetical protein